MADSKITALTALTSPLVTDIIPIVSDPGGTPVTKKSTLQSIADLFKNITEVLTNKDLSSSTNKFPVGTVIQTVTVNYSTTTTATNTTIDTGLAATITPRFSTSKVLVIVNQAGMHKNNVNSGGGISLSLLRGASLLISFGYAIGYGLATNFFPGNAGCSYLDSPATTSATTYKTQFGAFDTVGPVNVNETANSSITLMEIAQ